MSEIPQVQQLRDKLLLLQQQSQANQSKIRHLEELLDGFSELFATKNPNQVLVQYRQVLKENIQLKETINMYEQGMEVVMNKYRQSVLEKSRPVQLQYQESSDLETENLYLKEELDKAMSVIRKSLGDTKENERLIQLEKENQILKSLLMQ